MRRQRDMIGKIDQVSGELVDATVICELGNNPQAIGQILTVIDDVADQTRLLALNATVIAAQAETLGSEAGAFRI